MSKTKTLKQEKADILKYELMKRALDAKNFYRDGTFDQKLSAVLDDARTPQGLLYDRISELGLRLASDLYGKETPAGMTYTDQTNKMIEDFGKDLIRQFREGIIPPLIYTNLAAFAQSEFNTALLAQKFSKSEIKKSPVGKTVDKLLNNAASISAIPQLENIQQQLIQQRATSSGENLALQNELERLQEVAKRFMVQGEKSVGPSDKVQEIDDTQNGDQPLQGLVAKRTGEVNDYNYNVPRFQNDPLRLKPADINSHGDQKQRALDALIRSRVEARLGMDTTYGLSQTDYERLDRGMIGMIKEDLMKGTEPIEFETVLDNIGKGYHEEGTKFDKESFVANYGRLYEDLYNDYNHFNQERANMIDSKEADDAQDITDVIRERQKFEANPTIDDKKYPSIGVLKNQTDAITGNIGKQDLFNLSVINNPNKILTDDFFKRLQNGKLPVIENDMDIDEQFGIYLDILTLQNTVGLMKPIQNSILGAVANPSRRSQVFTKKSAKELRGLFGIDSLLYSLELLQKIEQSDKTKPNSRSQEDTEKFEEEVEKTGQTIAKMIDVTKKSKEDYPDSWLLKAMVDQSREPFETILDRFFKKIEELRGQGKSVKKFSAYKAARTFEPQRMPIAVGAKTARVPQSANTYSIGNTTYWRQS